MLIAGVDEAGRGALAGPVVVAAVILDPAAFPAGLADSKRLAPQRRMVLAGLVRRQAIAWCIRAVDAAIIDRINILQATLLGMRAAVHGLRPPPRKVLVDGNRAPSLNIVCETVIGGDATEAAISAASILAKTHRDELLRELDADYPQYGFARHKGYPTREHRLALLEHGPCPVHRRSFAPVRLCGSIL